ncbi:transposase, partial [Staphylococcus epidermidis]
TKIFNSTNKGRSMEKAKKNALQLRGIFQETFPNFYRHYFLVEKLRLLSQQLKQSIPQLNQLDDAIIQLAQKLDYFENIHSIPVIGKLSTAMIIGEIGDIKRFTSNKQLNAFVGIDIKRYQSGHTPCRATINRRGKKKQKKLFFWLFINKIKGQPPYNISCLHFYNKQKKKPNK